jgi:hypothetical protein
LTLLNKAATGGPAGEAASGDHGIFNCPTPVIMVPYGVVAEKPVALRTFVLIEPKDVYDALANYPITDVCSFAPGSDEPRG